MAPIGLRLGVAMVIWSASGAALSATFTVTKTSDTADGRCDSDCSLREAIAAANASPGLDTVVLKGTTYKIARLTPQDPAQDDNAWVDEDGNTAGDFDITDAVVIRGKAGYTAVDGALRERVFEVLSGVTAELRDLEIRNGYVPERGAGLANAGTTTLSRVRMRLNRAASGFNFGQGGAVFNAGTLTIVDSHVLDNDAGGGEASAGEGGGIYNTGRLDVRTTRFVGNTTHDDNDIGGGGAIMNRGGEVTIDRAFFQHNGTSLHGHGGAIANRDGGHLGIRNATVSANGSGEPPNWGGAIANGTGQNDAGTMTLSFLTVVDNDGGGIFNGGEMTLYDSIVAGNWENYGGASRFYDSGGNCVTLTASTFAGNVVGTDGNCRAQTGVDNASALTLVVYPLENNGGFAPTHALRYAFKATIDTATCGGGCPADLTDQRGVLRPQDGNYDGVKGWDIGAFERADDD